MPAKLRECTIKGQKGWASEAGGHCFTGSNAREQAVKQVEAINISIARKEGKSWVKNLPAKK